MQFGSTLQRLLQRLVYANKLHGPPLITKINLADSYYRVPLNPSAALALAVVIPSDTTEQSLIALPLVLPMGWAHSPPPPYFCVFTKTITDMVNAAPPHHSTINPHPLLVATQLVATQQPSAQSLPENVDNTAVIFVLSHVPS
jgi:hypothetical protein